VSVAGVKLQSTDAANIYEGMRRLPATKTVVVYETFSNYCLYASRLNAVH